MVILHNLFKAHKSLMKCQISWYKKKYSHIIAKYCSSLYAALLFFAFFIEIASVHFTSVVIPSCSNNKTSLDLTF